ncbi:MAG: anti-sigma factor antagonist, partial [Mycobacteriales bacterium]
MTAPAGFAVSVGFVGAGAVLGVRGEVDICSAPELAAIVTGVIDRGHRRIVLDLAECDFMDASGLQVIADVAKQLAVSGEELIIRAPSVMVRRILAITGLASQVQLEASEPAPAHLGAEQPVDVPGTPPALGSPVLAHQLRRATAIPADDAVVDAALRLVVTLARATVGGADGVSVSLRRHGRLSTVAASDQTISDMDTGQYATGEGPCVDASVQGRWFHAESLDSETRWPAFTPRARALGINAILSSPLLARDQPVGALNIYSRTAVAFEPADQQLAAVFAAEASNILTAAGVDVTDEALASRLQEALRT